MRTISKIISLIIIVSFFTISYANAETALQYMKKKEKVIKKVLSVKAKKGTKVFLKKESDLKENINLLFDFEELGLRALDYHWEGLEKAQQKEFIETLQALIEKNYLLKITSSASYKIKWYKQKQEDDFQVVRFKIKSGKYRAAIQLRVMEKAGKHVVFDMLIDDVSLMENYRSQFNKIIRKNGFDKLMEKMKNKLAKLDEEPGSGKISDDKLDSDKPKTKKSKKATFKSNKRTFQKPK